MNHKHGLINQIISSVLLFAMIVTLIPLADHHEHTAEAAVPTISSRTCPKGGGNPVQIGDAGCSACGGRGKRYDGGPKAGADEGFSRGANYGMNIKEEIDGNRKTVTYYRCYNCGDTGYDCKQYDEEIYTDNFSWDGQEWKFSYRTPGSASRSEGYVPIRWCPTCGPILNREGQSYETIATWAQIHVEEVVVKTYTVKVVANPSSAGTAGDSGTYEEGKTINLWYAPKAGYMFTGWSGATVTNDTHTVSKNVTITANFAKVTPGPTQAPVSSAPLPTKVVLPPVTPKPTPTPKPPRYEKAPQIVVPTAAPIPAPRLPEYSDEHEDVCYTGYEHIHNNCSYPVYHSHWSSCYHTHSNSCYVRPCDLGAKTYVESGHSGTQTCSEYIQTSTGGYARCDTQFTVYYTYTLEICGCGEVLGYRSSRKSGVCTSCGNSYSGVGGSSYLAVCPNSKNYSDLNCGYYDDTPICGKTTSYVEYYADCGKTEGYYYDSYGTKCDPICDQIVVGLTPLYSVQTLQVGDTPDFSAYAEFMSSSGKHKDYPPAKKVTCNMSGFNASKYNQWQTVTLSYGTYANSAKNKKATTTTIQVYIASNITVTFDANGGTVSITTKTVTYGKTYGTLPIPSHSGDYSFDGWIYNGARIEEDSIVATATNHTLTAAWISLSQNVTFDANGGTVSPEKKTVIYGKPYGELPTPNRSGYVFNGWWYGNKIVTSSSIVEADGDHKLIADWAPDEYTITLNPNGGNASVKEVQVRYDSDANNTVSIRAEYAGYTLDGWFTAVTGGTQIYDALNDEKGNNMSAKWSPSSYWKNGVWSYVGNVTVYARWIPNTYTITLNGMGATSLPQTSTTMVYLKTGSRVQVPTRTGYSFDGFYTEPMGEGTQMFNSGGYSVSPWIMPADGTVYANWFPLSYTIEVAEDEIRVEPVVITKTDTLDYNDAYTIPSALGDKRVTVSYDLREEATGTSMPTITLTAANTNAYHTFMGWQLFRNSGGKYNYIRLYSAGTTVQFLTFVQDDVLTLFPYWSGSGATVELPEPTCIGYNFRGWGFAPYEPNPDNLLYPEEGGDNTYKPIGDETLYAQWSAKNYVVELVAKDATTQLQTSVTATFDRMIPNITIPERDMYRFMGYYDRLNADGTPASDAKQYYDKDGTGLETWTEEDEKVTRLYAYWKENPNGSIYNFEVYDIFGSPAWEEIVDGEYRYTVGMGDESMELWDTLPLRTGVHPLYHNQGGLPVGGGFSFRAVSTGIFAEEDVILTMIPYLCPVGESGYYEGDLYFEQETDRGSFLKKWRPEEQAMILYADKDSMITEDGLSRVWSGNFQLPENLWVAKIGATVSEYQQQFGLNFEELFWIKDARLMLRFNLCLENGDGECLYYGMLPEESEENVWVQEAGKPYREDYDKNRYEILGGEIAVIYPGDSADRWYQIHGIY